MTVDTLKIYERLKNHSMPEDSARELAEVFKENIEEARAELATKKDVDNAVNLLRKEMVEMKYDMVKWPVGVGIASSILIIGSMASLLKILKVF